MVPWGFCKEAAVKNGAPRLFEHQGLLQRGAVILELLPTYGSIAQAGVFAQIVMVKDLEEELVAIVQIGHPLHVVPNRRLVVLDHLCLECGLSPSLHAHYTVGVRLATPVSIPQILS